MVLVWCVVIISCWTAGMHGYSVQRLEDDRSQPLNLEIDFLSTAENNKFFDDLEKINPEDPILFNHRSAEVTPPIGTNGAQKQMFILFVPNDNYTGANNESTPLDSWSVVWYIASFGGLIIFFLIVSCSEWCCRRAIRNSQQNCSRNAPAAVTATVPDTPPPSYDQFAPPSYESICLGRGEKSEYDIYVVPAHSLDTLVESRGDDSPPSYLSASGLENNRVT